ncbi:MAG: carbamate kinase [Propionibacteriales bacterium]|nr:carbamate kinase [Propionibacteriales bacterium]
MRVLLALGGNAMTGPDGSARPEDQISAAEQAMTSVAGLVAEDIDVVLTHGNGPQVGNLLVKNEISASVVPPVPLDWCGAQTQGTLGFILLNALERALVRRGLSRPMVALVTRTLVNRSDPAFDEPTKPIGRYLSQADAEVLMEHGQTFEERGGKGWRRLVASPAPLEILEADVVSTLVDSGYLVVANGGGGIPVVRDEDGVLRGVEAVIDKDLGAALLAKSVAADRLVIATDVESAILRYGKPDAEPIGEVSVATMRTYIAEGHFARGSMGPKVEAVCQFVEASGKHGVITSLSNIVAGVRGETGTIVVPQS